MGNKIDLTGKKFGRLIVVEEAGRDKHGKLLWKCKCECGQEKITHGSSLKRGLTKSCGCAKKGINKKHGMSGTRFYAVWSAIIHRCQNKNATSYKDYGGRGITVCERWQDFSNFLADTYDNYLKHVEEYGEDNTTIERINVNGNYESGNVRWATYQEQARNQRLRADNKSGHVGVGWNKERGKWIAHIRVSKERKYLGLFTDLDLAVEARKAAEEKYFNTESIS